MVNMVASTDGASSVDGVSGGLGDDGDALVFRAIRASCDWVMVAAGTVRAEQYGIPRPAPEVARRRKETGRSRATRLAVITASVNLDLDLPMFADQRKGDAKPLLVTGANPPSDQVAAIGDRAEWVNLAADRPTPALVLAALRERGAKIVLAEGGPSFNGQLADACLIDELCLTVSPQLIGGLSPRIVHGACTALAQNLTLVRLLEHNGTLFARYVRADR